MFTLLNKQHRQLGSGEHKQPPPPDDNHPHAPLNNRLTKRKARTATTFSPKLTAQSASSAAPLLSASSYIADHPQRVARINFHRLLSRLERRVHAASSAAGERKEELNSVREQTLLRKVSRRQPTATLIAYPRQAHSLSAASPLTVRPALLRSVWRQSLESLRSQLEVIQGELDKATLTDYVHRLTRLWTDAHIDPQHAAQTQAQTQRLRTHAANAITDSTPLALPPLPILSSSILYPAHPTHSASPGPASATSAHPIADASHFTAQHTRPARPTAVQLRSQLFAHSTKPTTADTAAASSAAGSHPMI